MITEGEVGYVEYMYGVPWGSYGDFQYTDHIWDFLVNPHYGMLDETDKSNWNRVMKIHYDALYMFLLGCRSRQENSDSSGETKPRVLERLAGFKELQRTILSYVPLPPPTNVPVLLLVRTSPILYIIDNMVTADVVERTPTITPNDHISLIGPAGGADERDLANFLLHRVNKHALHKQ